MNRTDPSLPNFVRTEAAEVRPDLALMADLLAGTRRMWAMAQERGYIRKWSDEDPSVYKIRKEGETLFEGFARVLSACVGMLHAKPPAMVWNASESAMTEQYANLDGQGTAGPVLLKRFSEFALRDGFGLILVDHPPPPPGVEVVTETVAVQYNLRPIWALYQREQLLSWRTALVNNVQMVTRAVLEESAAVPDGAYGMATKRRYRVLTLLLLPPDEVGRPQAPRAAWELFEETKETGQAGFVSVGAGYFTNRTGAFMDHLPLRAAYTGRTDAPLCASIPLLGVAWANLTHWRKATNLSFSQDVAAFAQAVVIGELAAERVGAAAVPGKVRLGPLAAIHLKGEGASFEWKSPPVEAFGALERALTEKLQQMGQMGMAFMISDTRAAETAAAKRLDATAENSTLATAGQGIEDAWNGALEDHAWYLGIEKAGAPVITINTDFDAIALDPQTMTAYTDAVARAGLPKRLLLEAWQRGGRIPAETDLDELEMEMEANAIAAEQQKADELAAQADMAQRAGMMAPGKAA
jgi:hypothetical protein